MRHCQSVQTGSVECGFGTLWGEPVKRCFGRRPGDAAPSRAMLGLSACLKLFLAKGEGARGKGGLRKTFFNEHPFVKDGRSF
jgi:hypothetical protein